MRVDFVAMALLVEVDSTVLVVVALDILDMGVEDYLLKKILDLIHSVFK